MTQCIDQGIESDNFPPSGIHSNHGIDQALFKVLDLAPRFVDCGRSVQQKMIG
jgi:hypothetical protein